MAKKVQVQLVRSVIGCPQWMRTVVHTMGLRKLNDKKVFNDNGAIRGMVKKVPHLVSLTEAKE
ncbi:MAG: 50S ribosomal protein L30 [Proteobacteria bacterium]|nr:50S ribosomal protein L30 [Pseudomonadota bacterium]NDC25753.1 50S ribosomal protein L30 [Pseudomonadota bacterium]NDD05564.1 50S ribosomal protein L30 [Pseudomonadota bacterium]NDG28065.1 50S ribosomal protein L30 [Pseudomonadota bacterium]